MLVQKNIKRGNQREDSHRSRHRNKQPNKTKLSGTSIPAIFQDWLISKPTKVNQLSPEQFGMLGQLGGNRRLLRTLATVQTEKSTSKSLEKNKKSQKDCFVTRSVTNEKKHKIIICVLKDKYIKREDMRNKAQTVVNLDKYDFPRYEYKNRRITKITGIPIKHSFTIQTSYGPNVTNQNKSDYGRGTTEKDKKAGNTSLGFHEWNHRKDFIAYIRSHPLPKFQGRVGNSLKAIYYP